MSGIYEWIRSLVFYLILMTMILNLLPDKKYEKYLRLYTGVVFLMLVFGPFTDLTGAEARIAGAFEQLTFQNDAKLLRREIEDADGKRMERLADGYREAVETDLRIMAEGISVECRSAEVTMETDAESAEFGRLRSVDMRIGMASGSGDRDERLRVNREIGNLRKRIGEYYGLEEGKITIFLEDE